MTWAQRRNELAFEYAGKEEEYSDGEAGLSLSFCGFKRGFDAGRNDTLERIQPLLDALEKYIGIPGNDCQGITKYSAAEVALAKWREEIE